MCLELFIRIHAMSCVTTSTSRKKSSPTYKKILLYNPSAWLRRCNICKVNGTLHANMWLIKIKKERSNGYTDNNKHNGMKERQFQKGKHASKIIRNNTKWYEMIWNQIEIHDFVLIDSLENASSNCISLQLCQSSRRHFRFYFKVLLT